jgi:lipopolysaccharide transport system permease protein
MIIDIFNTLSNWRLIHLLGLTSIRSRYARSKFGQAWLTLSNLILIISISLVWSLIWKMPIKTYLPYVGIGHLIYLFVAQTISESSGIFIADARLYLNDKKSFLLSLFAHLYRSILIFAHNVPIIVILVIWGDTPSVNFSYQFFLAVFFMLIFMSTFSYIVAVICVRFRDMIQLVNLFFQVIFLVTPVMWQIVFLDAEFQSYVVINPFAAILESIRNPLIGIEVHEYALISLAVWTLVSTIFSVMLYRKMHRNIIYWI